MMKDLVDPLGAAYADYGSDQRRRHEAFGQQAIQTWSNRTQTLVTNPGPKGGRLMILPEAGTATYNSAR